MGVTAGRHIDRAGYVPPYLGQAAGSIYEHQYEALAEDLR